MMADDGIEIMDAEESAETWRRGLAGAIGLIAGAVLFALVLLVAHGNSERDAAQERERRSYDILMIVRGLDSSMARGEAALGRFVINGNPKTGTLYYDDWKQAGRQLNRLAQLTADNPLQSALVKELKTAYDQRSIELAAPATRAFYKQGWAALSLFDQAGKSKSIAHVSKILDRLEANERATLDLRSDRADDRANWTNWLSNVLSGMGVLIGMSALLLGWLAFNAIQQRRIAWNDADIESDRSAYLQIAVGERTRELVLVNEKLREEAATRIAAEAQLRQIQKMEAVGQLTGGIAHDFNNMLAVVVGSLDLARRRLNRDEEEARRHIENAMDGANRAASLTRRLLSFARHEPLLPEGVAPGKLIRGMSDLLDRTLGERITVTTRGFDADWQVWVDPHQLENAILNLAVNARDAMDGEGALTIESDQLRLGDGEVGSLAAGEYIRIAVTDTGCGMDQAVLERVFEPFFTTKPVGKGTGLGLSQVFGLARQSSGEVTVRSAPEEGATVSIYLPRHIAKSPRQANAVELVAVENAPLTAALNILVVEDDQRVRAATVAALEELGHAPVPCTAGADALEILETRTDIGLIITDVVMPGMTGPELISQVSTLYPHLAVLFVTGYAGEAGDAESFTGHEVLRKPFTINTLALSIAAARNRQINVPPLLARGGAAA